MEIVPIEVFGIHLEVALPAPQGLAQARLDEFGASLCDPAKGLSLRPDQIRLKRWDDLFGYELSAQFFGENGSLTRTADRIKLGVRNARTAGDWQIILQTLVRFYNLMAFEEKSLTNLAVHVHGRFPNAGERDGWLGQFSINSLVTKPAALGYVRIFDWEKEIRVMIEHSNLVPDAVFCAWDTQFQNNQEWDSFLGSLPTMMENSANFFEIGFEPLREKV